MAAARGVELVREFVNTDDADAGTDAIASPDALAGWLREQGLAERPRVSAAEHRRAVALRDALRAAVRARSHGEPVDTIRTAAALAPYPLRLVPHADGSFDVAPLPDLPETDAAVAAVAAAVVAAQRDGSWFRLKICAEHSCAWAFVDRSRNRSGRWCSMQVCGNRTKTRAYRSRQRG